MKQKNLNNLISKILIVFLIIQPIFDLKIFYNSISTFIRVIIIFALFAYYFLISKNKKKYLLLIYPCLLGIYFIFHHMNALEFTSLVPGNFNYNIVKEALYFAKMISPFMLIYCIYKAQLSSNTIIDIMKYLVLIISLTIVVTNLIGISYGSYSDAQIKASFFEWFNPNSQYTYTDLASKGLFEYGNQISAILIMFLPFTIYLSIEKRGLLNYLITGLNVFALILLCTKVSVLGIVVVIFYTMFAFGFIAFIQKKRFVIKQYVPVGAILLIYCMLFPFNPMFSRIQERATVVEDFYSKNIQDSTLSDLTTDDTQIDDSPESSSDSTTSDSVDITKKMIEYIESNYESKKLDPQFLYENYPYKYDPEFWYEFLHNDIWQITDYRYIELSMVKRVVEINNNPMDKWFGITNTRLQNIFNIERDFVVQYYALGIIGAILIFAPYFILLGIFAFQTLHDKFKNLNIISLLAGITIVFLFGISYMSGNLFNSLSFTIYFALCFRLLHYENNYESSNKLESKQ